MVTGKRKKSGGMKRGVLNVVVLMAVVACAVSCSKEDEGSTYRVKPVIYTYPRAEYHKAGAILMYTPGTELFDGIIHPDAGLYERYFDIDKAADEHRNYISMLEAQGCTVYTVTDVLLTMPHDRLVGLAEASLTYDVSGLPLSEQEAQDVYKREVLASMSNSDLVRIIINRPTVILRESGINTGFEAQYVHEPLMNMYFLRDQSITTPKGHVMCRMNSSQRAPEVDIIEACYEQLGEPAIYRVKGENSQLEGGDYIPFGTISLIGQGLRTSQEAIDELLENDCFGHDTVVVVRERWKDQYQMHLDTYFNVIDKDLCTMCFNRYDAKGKDDVNYLTMDMYVRPAGEKAYRQDSVYSGKGFREFLESRGVRIIRISKEDADHYANNFLTVDARHIMSVAGQSKELEGEYAKNNVQVEWVPLDNLIGGYGAAHCMTQVLRRGSSEW